ncbi:LytR family transcriptional regulator [Patescibacteria group bacterium]|nr:MAG: LytR family transcriptional regulator [Patescibacteria group bacterium]
MSDKPKIDFLAPVAHGHPRYARRRIARALLFIIVLSTAGLFTLAAAAPGENLTPILQELSPRAVFASVGRLILSPERRLKGEAADRINVLILGIGGAGHDGPLLTDTILLASLKPSTHELSLLSIPRDLLADVPGYGWRRINSVNAYAETNSPGSGAAETARVLENVLGVTIPYYVRVDFAGFKKFIDALGGVLVYIDRSFTDNEYPTANPDEPPQTVSFAAGWQRLTGERALIYSRSRHGSNFEGSDFARSRRQQKIILAVKEELMSAGVLANPGKIMELSGIAANHVQTNIEPWELLSFASLARAQKPNGVIRRTLDPELSGLLVPAMANGAYVLLPANGNFEAVRALARDIFNSPGAENSSSESSPLPAAGAAVRLELQNGTTLSGFAARAAENLRQKGFAISYIGNAASRSYERTVIYDLSGGKHPEALTRLRTLLDADVSATIPEWFADDSLPPSLTASVPEPQGGRHSTDFLVILGQSSASLLSTL